VGLQLGVFNYQRGSLFSQTRNLILMQTIKAKYQNDEGILNALKPQPQADSIEFSDPAFGQIKIKNVTAPDPGSLVVGTTSSIEFLAEVKRGGESWTSEKFSLNHRNVEDQLERALAGLAIANDQVIPPNRLIQRVQEAIYSRRIKLPSLDFGDFNTESAAWLIGILCVGILVALRNVVHRIFHSGDTGIGETWLVLDARDFGEKLVAGIWISAICLSGWLAVFGLVLSMMDVFQIATLRPSVFSVSVAYVVFGALFALGTWAGVGTTADLLRLRQLRRLLDGRHSI
jgi:hypothetical protein